MIRAVWIGCVVIFSAFAIACGAGSQSKVETTAALKRTGGDPDTERGKRVEGVGEPVVIGGLQVRILNPRITRVPMVIDEAAGRSQDEELILNVELVSVDPGKKFEYTTWTGGEEVAVDDLGNRYKTVLYSNGRPKGRVVNATVYSDKKVSDVIVFQKPVPAAKHLDIDLPAPRQFGEGASFRFRIAMKDVDRN